MKLSLRLRLVLAALVPVIVVAVGLTAILLTQHLREIEQALDQRGRALARQSAAAAEFSLYTGNREFLLTVAMGVLRTDGDVVGVAVVDAAGQIIAQSGTVQRAGWPALGSIETLAATEAGRVFAVPVEQRTLAVDDAYSGAEIAVATRPRTNLGHVVVEISSLRMHSDRQRLVWVAVLTALVGAAIGGALALSIARGVMRPVLEATETVTRIGRGDLVARVDEGGAGPLQDLAAGINAMAVKVGMKQEDLRGQVEAATAELKRQRDAAERATAAKSRFLAAASHDLRQPMHALGLFVSRLTSHNWPREQVGVIHQVEESVEALQQMLETLLDMSRLEVGGYRVENLDFEIGPLLAGLSRDLMPLAEEKRLDLRLRPTSAWAYGDPRLVTRIVLNLLSNALRYTQRGGVLLACRRVGDKWRIQVWDSGAGITPALQEDIFDEYVQVGNPERDRAKGLGLGLAISQRAAALLGSKIEVRSVLGKGSVFWFDLPCGTPQVVAAGSGTTLGQGMSGLVLVVDDDPACRDGTAAAIATWGSRVLVASSASEALEVCRGSAEAPVVAICDIRLQGEMDGIELGRHLKVLCPAVRIVLISADQTPMTLARARAAGFPLLKKPVSPSRLRAALSSLIETGEAPPLS